MADYNDSINLGGAVWKPVPADKNEPFARTSRGSWTWPKTPVKEPDWGKKLDVGAGNAAPWAERTVPTSTLSVPQTHREGGILGTRTRS